MQPHLNTTMIRTYLFIVLSILLGACSNGQNNTSLTATAFSEKIKQSNQAIIVDVRTPGEYAEGHIANAHNIDYNGADFDKQIAALDTSKEYMVYCLSGGRSSSAANKMRKAGFTKVYELQGGMMKWRAAKLPEVSTTPQINTSGLTKQQFEQLLNTNKIVLVDFYADWCAPCRKIKPYIEEIAKEMKDKVEVITINADDNKALLDQLQIDELPTLQIYRNKKATWTNIGLTTKEEIVKALNK